MFPDRTISLVLIVVLFGSLSASPIFASPQSNTYIVNTNANGADANPGDGICRTSSWLEYCTLEAAIQESNADGVDSIIHFSKQFNDTNYIGGCSLPSLTSGNTTIDASSQWDTTFDRPGVEILCLGGDNLVLESSGNVIRGILFSGTNNIGVHILGPGGDSNTIGGDGTHQRNIFVSGIGVQTVYGDTSNNMIIGNYFGTIDGNSIIAGGSKKGINLMGGYNNFIKGNVIVGHNEHGILVHSSEHNNISANAVGSNRSHTSILPNKIGIEVYYSNYCTIGPSNWIAGNDEDGLYLYRSTYAYINGNTIGYCYFDLGNDGDGIYTSISDNISIFSNVIDCNKGNGLLLEDGSELQVFGNHVKDNGSDGIYLHNAFNVKVGDGISSHKNYIVSNGANGVHLNGSSLTNVSVMNNDIGLESVITDGGNAANGVLVEGGAHHNTIGGVGAYEGNWISFNDGMGIRIDGSTTNNNTVVGNVIGAVGNWSWEAPNGLHGIGIYNGAHNNSIGMLFLGNYILASGWSGIGIYQSNNNAALFNYIGTDGTGADWGNSYYGIHAVNSQGNNFNFNEIAYNDSGVFIDGGTAIANQITTNSIHDHTSDGIQLTNGGNNLLNAPVITSAVCSGPVVGTACANCLVEIFSDSGDEGRVYEGWIRANGSGNFSWSGTLNGPHISATATDAGNNTSPFSSAFNLGTACNQPPTASFTYSPPSGGDRCTTYTFNASNSTDPEDPNSALRVRWDFDNNGFFETDWSTTKTITHRLGSPTSPTLHTVRLQVIDTRNLGDAATQTIALSGVDCFNHLYIPLVIN